MKTAIGVGGPASGKRNEWASTIDFVVEAEKLGVDYCWSAEAWGHDAVVPLAYLAAKTERMILGSGIMQISARTPSMTAMTALTLASISDNRFVLGLGASGPQVVEGLQGRPFKGPLTRMRETVDIIRQAFAGEKISYKGKYHQLPLPGGEGKALRLSQPGNPDIPIYLATLSPKSLEMTGEIADGWLGTSFIPEQSSEVIGQLDKGAKAVGKTVSDLDIQIGGNVCFSENVESLLAERKAALAFQLGAMGSADHNFYNDAFKRQGFEEDAIAVQKLWVSGKRDQAVERVPDDMVLKTSLLGTEEMVLDRLKIYKEAGVTSFRIDPSGNNLTERLDTLGKTLELIKSL